MEDIEFPIGCCCFFRVALLKGVETVDLAKCMFAYPSGYVEVVFTLNTKSSEIENRKK